MSNNQPISTFLGIAAAVVLATSSSGFGVNPCPEDINQDGAVNVLDLIALLLAFGNDCTGACCNTDGTCTDGASQAACVAAGGTFQGIGSVCVPGLCAAPDQGCQLPDNLAHGGIFGANSSCTPGSVLGNESAFIVADDFNIDIDTVVDHVQWWGIYFDAVAAVDCAPGPVGPVGQTFEIAYYDSLGVGDCPGALLGSFLVPATPVDTGRIVFGLPVFEYEAKHPPLTLLGGQCYWLAIRNRIDLADPLSDCSWFWETAGDPPAIGNGRSVQQGGAGGGTTCVPPVPTPWVCPGDLSTYDLAWCLQGPSGAGGEQQPIKLGDPSRCFIPPPVNKDLCIGANPIVINDPLVTNNTTVGFTVDVAPVCIDEDLGIPVPIVAPGVWYTVIGDDVDRDDVQCGHHRL